ncbi:ABC transporter ATP-binding protein [bacterium]|nr:ABC transporter ATP-binding protein [bacterium]
MTRALIQTDGLTKQYGSLLALDHCKLGVNEGEVFGLLGPNGSGKTTLIRLLMGYLKPTAGWAKIDNLDCYHDSVAVHARLSYLPAEVRLFFNMRGRDVLKFFARMHPAGDFERAIQLAERLELDLSRLVAFCSTGMKQKIALVSTLATRTPLVILDEPTSALDPTVRREVMALINEAKREGRTIIFSSHVLSETEATCDRVCILRRGKLVHTEALASIKREHRIRARITGPFPTIPDNLRQDVELLESSEKEVVMQTASDVATLFGWLGTLPIDQVRIDPISLQAVYDRYHGTQEIDPT